MGSTDADRTNPPATLKELVDIALELRPRLADLEWAQSTEGREEVRSRIHWLVLAIAHLWIGEKKFTVEQRLARAQAEVLYGACRRFELTTKDLTARRPVNPEDWGRLEAAGLELFVALGQFVAMAEGL